MRGSHNRKLPKRFDDRVTLEIEDDADGRPTVRMQDRTSPEEWISADISALVSLPEYE
ncbi:hypothetical protein NGM10_09615 [Halorussus salilacus]|uniref:hypothetical protein n=1 Tax=Halorussus salilacus TaxID=2953750 RepID=UPI00209F09EB|nr:hypothetical protein [Halorussus salilacus]USZ66987.1 hypothetical protein NGM10_09615 [Halorussus salilacus]